TGQGAVRRFPPCQVYRRRTTSAPVGEDIEHRATLRGYRRHQKEGTMSTVSTIDKPGFGEHEKDNPLVQLQKFGQSFWLDYIRRNLITSGELQRLIDEDGLRGMTSNPSIFEKAITGSTDYADFLEKLRSENLSAGEIFERIAVRDIQDAADHLRPVYDATKRRDGYVSLEV